MVFERSSKSVSGKLTLCFKEVLKEFQGSLKTTSSREISERLKGVSRKIGGYSRER